MNTAKSCKPACKKKCTTSRLRRVNRTNRSSGSEPADEARSLTRPWGWRKGTAGHAVRAGVPRRRSGHPRLAGVPRVAAEGLPMSGVRKSRSRRFRWRQNVASRPRRHRVDHALSPDLPMSRELPRGFGVRGDNSHNGRSRDGTSWPSWTSTTVTVGTAPVACHAPQVRRDCCR